MPAVDFHPSAWLEYLRKPDNALLKCCRMDVYKATGKGGQKRNKTENAIRLTLSNLSVTDSSTRSRATNIQRALRKMRLAIALDIDDAAHQRSQFQHFPAEVLPHKGGLIRINPTNPDFPFFIASLVDVYIKCHGDWKQIAGEFSVSASQIQRFVKKHSFFSAVFNRLDGQFGMDKSQDL